MNILVAIAIVAVFLVGAIALGMKFFNTSVEEEEKEKGW